MGGLQNGADFGKEEQALVRLAPRARAAVPLAPRLAAAAAPLEARSLGLCRLHQHCCWVAASSIRPHSLRWHRSEFSLKGTERYKTLEGEEEESADWRDKLAEHTSAGRPEVGSMLEWAVSQKSDIGITEESRKSAGMGGADV